MKFIPIVTTVSLITAGCTMFDAPMQNSQKINTLPSKSATTSERVPGRYSLLTPQATGVVAVFEEGNRTMIQFARGVPDDLILVDVAGKVLRFERYSNYAIVLGQYDGILMRSGGGQSYATTGDPSKVTAPSAAAAAPSTTPATAVQPIDPATPDVKPGPAAKPVKNSATDTEEHTAEVAQTQSTPAESLSHAEHQLRTIEAELAPTQQSNFSVAQIMKKVAALEKKVEGLNSTIVRVRFGVARTRLELPIVARDAFRQAAEASERIEVRGRTDSMGAPKTNSRVAYDRAMAARAYLVSLGVPAEKIRVNALPMTDYVADNVTAEGRARNRRVDFVFIAPESDTVKVSLESSVK